MTEKKKTEELTREDFSLIDEPEYLSTYASVDKYYGMGLRKIRKTSIRGLAGLFLLQLVGVLAVVGFGGMSERHISSLVASIFSLCLMMILFVLMIVFKAERLAKNYALTFSLAMGNIFVVTFWITCLASFMYSKTATQAALYWLSVGGVAALSFLAFYARVTHQIKKGEYREGGGGLWGRRLRHFAGRHLLPFVALVASVGVFGIVGIFFGARKLIEFYYPEMSEGFPLFIALLVVTILIFSALGYLIGVHSLAYRKFGIKYSHYTKI